MASRTGRFRATSETAAQLDQHLTSAIAELAPPTEGKPMRGMQRLAHLTQTAVADMDKKADAIADRIAAAQARGHATMDKFDSYAASIEQAADDAEKALAQLTNSPPPLSGS
ncbi:hypothetical protein [Bradyrhizobium elkanii]|uniref:CHASE3 domain sensor protein n=1 Tax=Bradyrhizobium elkanii TaxID=29448 RepID=A0A8I1YDK1_BRAEL|nr:hypothetical protein [Bradyrhizobium elkanii]MBP1296609.1 CHASE3 domain sensor protein [Bradyrhizobium elkanii]